MQASQAGGGGEITQVGESELSQETLNIFNFDKPVRDEWIIIIESISRNIVTLSRAASYTGRVASQQAQRIRTRSQAKTGTN